MKKKASVKSDLRVGDPVLFVLQEGPTRGKTRPAIVVEVDDNGAPTLHVFLARGDAPPKTETLATAPRDDSKAHGSWHHPPKAPASQD